MHRFFKNAHSISALVITKCEGTSDAYRERIAEEFKSADWTKKFAAIMGKGIYVVGFPPLDKYEDSGDYKKHLKLKMEKDLAKLHHLIEESSDAVNVCKGSDPAACSISRLSV